MGWINFNNFWIHPFLTHTIRWLYLKCIHSINICLWETRFWHHRRSDSKNRIKMEMMRIHEALCWREMKKKNNIDWLHGRNWIMLIFWYWSSHSYGGCSYAYNPIDLAWGTYIFHDFSRVYRNYLNAWITKFKHVAFIYVDVQSDTYHFKWEWAESNKFNISNMYWKLYIRSTLIHV